MSLNPTFSVNNYNKPKVLTELESYVNDILMLLFGKPGFYPSIPTLGMDIRQYLYMFEDEVNVEEIKTTLAEQCSEFLPELQTGELDVIKTQYNGNTLLIFKLPIINDTNKNSAAIGITTNDKGELVYNFVETDNQIL